MSRFAAVSRSCRGFEGLAHLEIGVGFIERQAGFLFNLLHESFHSVTSIVILPVPRIYQTFLSHVNTVLEELLLWHHLLQLRTSFFSYSSLYPYSLTLELAV